MKPLIVIIISLLLVVNVAYGQRELMPNAKGEVKRSDYLNNSFDYKYSPKTLDNAKSATNKVAAIILDWDNLQPPIGFEAGISTIEHILQTFIHGSLEVRFTPYFKDKDLGVFADYKFSSVLNIYINFFGDYLPGNPLCKDIYVKPRKINDYYGADIYQTSRGQVTLMAKNGVDIFLPVSQEEFLMACIREETAKESKSPVPQKVEYLKDVENAYLQLLKIDRVEAENYKKAALKDADEFYSNTEESISAKLKKELESMSLSEKKRQAYYSIHAIEKFNKVSGLCPLSSLEEGEPLVKINPVLFGFDNSGEIKLLVVSCSEDDKEDKYLKRLYVNENIWRKIFDLIN